MATVAPIASAQVTVPFTDTSWQGFGTTNIVGVTGNFLPGWETVVISPDLGVNLFGNPNQTLSGAPDDAALWMLQFPSGSANTEEARLSLPAGDTLAGGCGAPHGAAQRRTGVIGNCAPKIHSHDTRPAGRAENTGVSCR